METAKEVTFEDHGFRRKEVRRQGLVQSLRMTKIVDKTEKGYYLSTLQEGFPSLEQVRMVVRFINEFRDFGEPATAKIVRDLLPFVATEEHLGQIAKDAVAGRKLNRQERLEYRITAAYGHLFDNWRMP